MDDKLDESISSLVDGEPGPHDSDTTLGRLLEDEQAQARWARYHLIGEAMRGNLAQAPNHDLARRVSEGIRDEQPVVVAFPPRRRTILKPVAGLALAASVAAMAILAVRSIEAPVGTAPELVSEVQQPTSELPATVLTSANRWNVEQQSVEDRLNGYLVDHSEYAGYGVQGMLPYARIVGYDTSER